MGFSGFSGARFCDLRALLSVCCWLLVGWLGVFVRIRIYGIMGFSGFSGARFCDMQALVHIRFGGICGWQKARVKRSEIL